MLESNWSVKSNYRYSTFLVAISLVYARLERNLTTALLTAKKFRSRGNKDGALRAFSKIEEEEALKQAR